jgi:hypothetical protein
MRARALVRKGQRGERLSPLNRPEQRHQPGQAIARMLERASDFELMQTGPFRPGSRAPLRPIVLEHRAVFHFRVSQPRRADPARLDQSVVSRFASDRPLAGAPQTVSPF